MLLVRALRTIGHRHTFIWLFLFLIAPEPTQVNRAECMTIEPF